MEDILSVSDVRLASVLDTAVDGIVLIDDKANILAFNKACEAMFGYDSEDVIGKNVRLLMPEDFASGHDQYVSNYKVTGHRKIIGIGREVKAQHREGRIFPIELSVGEAKTPDGRQFIGIIRDITKRKESEQRIAELQEQLIHMARVSAIDEMGAAIAHELNQPLTALMLYLQAAQKRLIQSNEHADARALEVMTKAAREAERAGDIIQRMRSFIERRDPKREVRLLRDLVDEAIELTLVGSRNLDVKVINDDEGDRPFVQVDAVQIQQIVVNLVRNAIEAISGVPNPEIHTACRSDGDSAILIVTDNGPGVPETAIHHMFKTFTSTKRKGLGLGLAISRSIAQSHGGDLTLEPGGHGQGASFFLRLPRALAINTEDNAE